MYSLYEKHTVQNVKQYLKDLAQSIRILKILRKMEKNQNLKGFDPEKVENLKQDLNSRSLFSTLILRQITYRQYHIAYSEFRGRTREEIEPFTKNPPNSRLIDNIKKQMEEAMEEVRNEREALRISA
jgi:hypothetical protein